MIRYIMWLVAILFGMQMLGCSTIVSGNGEWGFKQSTSWSIYASKQGEEEVKIEYKFPSLEDWIK